MYYKDSKILEINPVVYLGEKFKDNNFKENQEFFKNKIRNAKFQYDFSFECPIEDLIHVHVDYRDNFIPLAKKDTLNRVSEVFKELSTIFKDVKINLYLDDYIEGIGNSVDLDYEEFDEYLLKTLDEFEEETSYIKNIKIPLKNRLKRCRDINYLPNINENERQEFLSLQDDPIELLDGTWITVGIFNKCGCDEKYKRITWKYKVLDSNTSICSRCGEIRTDDI